MRYKGIDLRLQNVSSYYTSSQLGLGQRMPRCVQDSGLLSSIVCLHDDEYPAIGPDLSQPANQINPEPPTYCLRFCPVPGHHNLLALANEDGRVAIQDTSKLTPKIPMTGHPCHDNAIFDLTWSQTNVNTMVTVSGDQKVCVWDISGNNDDNLNMKRVREFSGHSRSVKCVEWRPEADNQLVTGARDNCIMLWDTRDRSDTTPDNVIRGAHSVATCQANKRKRDNNSTSGQGVVTSLAWVDSNTLVSAGDKDGVVKMWDLRKNYSLYKGEPVAKMEIHHPGDSSTVGYTSLSVSTCQSHVYVSCMDDKIYKYNIVSGDQTPEAVFTGSSIKNFFIKMSLSPCGRYIAGGSADNWAYVWNTSSPGSPVARLGEAMAEVTCVAWSQDMTRSHLATLVTASDDMKHQIWRLPPQVPDNDDIKYSLDLLNKVDVKKIPSHPPGTPSVKTPRRIAQTTPGLSSKKQTPSIKSFLTPSNIKTPKAQLTPTNEERRGLKRRQCSFNDENSPEYSGTKRDLTSSISSLLSSPASKCSFTPQTYKSPTKKISCSPVKKCHLTPRRIGSPLKLFSPLREIRMPQSPTANLPNFNIDGRSPRGTVNKNKGRKAAGTNWLTAYAKEKKQGTDASSQSKLKETIVGLSSKSNQRFSKIDPKKPSKKKVVRLK